MKMASIVGAVAMLMVLNGHLCLAASIDGAGPGIDMALAFLALPVIELGMTRSQVEAQLTERDGGPQGISYTRYYREPGYLIEVSYDQTGGTWGPDNHVSGPVTVLKSPRHLF